MSLRVLLADDHRLFRQGLDALLRGQGDIEIVGSADDGRSVLEIAGELRPDVIVMDINMPGLNGIDATRQVLAVAPGAHVLALSAHRDPKRVREALRAGAAGYVLKEAAIEELLDAIRVVAAGQTYVSPELHSMLGDAMHDHGNSRLGNGNGFSPSLSPREREVLQLLAEGKATKETAAVLRVSVKTAETHRRSIMEKLNLHSIAELTKYAIREGFTTVEC